MRLLEELQILSERIPEHIAVTDSGQSSLTYRALWQRVLELSKELSVRQRSVVLCAPRSVELVCHLLAVWKAGGTPMMVDVETPEARLSEMISLVKPRAFYREGHIQELPVEDSAPSYPPGGYLVATSGSTGSVKVVHLSGAGLWPVLSEQVRAFGLAPGKRVLWALSVGFDASLSDIGTALLSGSTLVCGASGCFAELPKILEKKSITHLDIPPALLEVYEPSDFPESLETLVVGGAPSRPETLRTWAQRFDLVAVYGPSEATICCSISRVNSHWTQPHIGQPIADFEFRIQEGEILISGCGLAEGYLGNHSCESFFTMEGKRWYRSGDLVKLSDSQHGHIFVGRADRQIQWRGQRLELEEIERRLWPIFGAHRVAALHFEDELFVFWEAERESKDLSNQAKQKLRELLPAAWRVGHWVPISKLPRTGSHKIDYSALAHSVPSNRDCELDSLAALALSLQLEKAGHNLAVCHLLGRGTIAVPAKNLKARLGWTKIRKSSQPRKKRPTLLITGIQGGLGQALKEPLSKHFQVLGLSRQPGSDYQGDITLPQLGLKDTEWDELRLRVDEVLNLACNLSVTESAEQLWSTNVEALRTLSQIGQKLHQASSLAVFLNSEPQVEPTDTGISPVKVLMGGYCQSKWAAECLHKSLSGGGHLFRYGQLLGPPRASDLLARVSWGLLELGHYPTGGQEQWVFDITPLDWATQRTVEILLAGISGVSNLSSGQVAGLPDLIQALQATGHTLKPSHPGDFFQIEGKSVNAILAQRALSRWHPDPHYYQLWRDLDLFLASGIKLAPSCSSVNGPRTLRNFIHLACKL